MPLFADYAITPDVFDRTSYSTAAECEARIETLREAMLNEGLVRNLRDGAWRCLFRSDTRPWHRRGIELVKKLANQGRLVPFGIETAHSAPQRPGLVRRSAGHTRRTTVSGRRYRHGIGQARVRRGTPS